MQLILHIALLLNTVLFEFNIFSVNVLDQYK